MAELYGGHGRCSHCTAICRAHTMCATGCHLATNVEATATAGEGACLRVRVCSHFALWTPLRYGMATLERMYRAL